MERSEDLSLPRVYFLFSGFCDVKAGPQPLLHHGRHLNQFPLLASYTTFTAAQVFNTAPFPFIHHYLFPAIFLLPPHLFLFLQSPAITPCIPTIFLPLPLVADQSIPQPFRFCCLLFSFQLPFPSPTLSPSHHLLNK